MAKRTLSCCLFVLAIPLMAASSPFLAHAHDIYSASKDPAVRLLTEAARVTPHAQQKTRGLIYNLYVWRAPRQLTVCFMDGDSATRDMATRAMQRWRLAESTDNQMSFRFLPRTDGNECLGQNADIRISFAGNRYWSAIGNDSRHASLLLSASMYLGGLKAAQWSENSDRVVIHETGHALGLLHEHQHPSRECSDPWDRDWILANTAWNTAAEMEPEFRGLETSIGYDQSAYTFLTYDRYSVMNYSFRKEAYKAGFYERCATPFNASPSDQDFDSIREAYSAGLQSELNQVRGNPGIFEAPIYNDLREYLGR